MDNKHDKQSKRNKKVISMSVKSALKSHEQEKQAKSNHDKIKERNERIIEIENEYNLPLITEIPKGKKSGSITVRIDASVLERFSTLAAKSSEFDNKSCIVRAMFNYCLPIFEKLYKNDKDRQEAIGKDLYDMLEQTTAYQMDKKLLDMITASIRETVDMYNINAIGDKEKDNKIKKALNVLPKNLKEEGKRRAAVIKGGEYDVDDLFFYRQSE